MSTILRMSAIVFALTVSGVTMMLGTTAFAQESGVECHVEWAPMRDGVRLATEVYLPEDRDGPLPVVMTRTPYNRINGIDGSNCDDPTSIAYAESGYAALNQDTRGKYRSEGTFNPIHQEAEDGYDAVEWAAAQPWSNGKVGIYGGSYVGLTTWQATIANPPHLVASAPGITASDYHDNWTYVNGANNLWFNMSWTHCCLAPDTYRRHLESTGLSEEEQIARINEWHAKGENEMADSWVWQIPRARFSEFRPLARYYYDWLDHPTYDDYWAQVDLETRYPEVTVPTLNTGAWYDIFQVGTVRNFLGMRSEGGTEIARDGSMLVMSCCGHAGTSGAISWGPDSTTPDPDLERRFFDHHLKGVDNGIDDEPAVQLYVLVPPDTGTEGGGFWISADEYPLPGTEFARFHLRSGGNANTRLGDGSLSASEPPAGPADEFVYDPRNPVPTVGGNLCCGSIGPSAERGAHDQATVELRDDVLVYTSAPLTEDVAVIGPVTVNFWAASSARDTDFTAKLVDVHPDGFAHNVLDRIVRARYRDGSKEPPSLIEPGQAYEYTLDLGNAGTVFREGHRIRLEISSSNFPRFDRNPNTGHPVGQDAKIRTANQTIYHDAAHPSYLELPVAPDIEIP